MSDQSRYGSANQTCSFGIRINCKGCCDDQLCEQIHLRQRTLLAHIHCSLLFGADFEMTIHSNIIYLFYPGGRVAYVTVTACRIKITFWTLEKFLKT